MSWKETKGFEDLVLIITPCVSHTEAGKSFVITALRKVDVRQVAGLKILPHFTDIGKENLLHQLQINRYEGRKKMQYCNAYFISR